MSALTLIHVVISLVGILAGFVVMFGMIQSKPLGRWNTIFLVTTILTSVTGFFFPIQHITPGLVIGVLSLVILSVSLISLYTFHLSGG